MLSRVVTFTFKYNSFLITVISALKSDRKETLSCIYVVMCTEMPNLCSETIDARAKKKRGPAYYTDIPRNSIELHLRVSRTLRLLANKSTAFYIHV